MAVLRFRRGGKRAASMYTLIVHRAYAARGIARFMPPAELCRTGSFSPGFAVIGL